MHVKCVYTFSEYIYIYVYIYVCMHIKWSYTFICMQYVLTYTFNTHVQYVQTYTYRTFSSQILYSRCGRTDTVHIHTEVYMPVHFYRCTFKRRWNSILEVLTSPRATHPELLRTSHPENMKWFGMRCVETTPPANQMYHATKLIVTQPIMWSWV